jgi:DNA-binding NtrC family response regulator
VFGVSFRHRRQAEELRALLDAAPPADDAPEILGDSAHTLALRRVLHETYIPSLEAENPEPILLLGERGAGKDLIARYLHAYSSRRKKPLVVVNCAEITDELAASRFFGHKKGSFTGALSDEPGFFRAASGGVLFLDEVAELSLRAQAHLLRVLESHTVVPVGQTREIPIDTAVVLATNQDPEEAVRAGSLRADFYDRFRTLAIPLLPLRERPWDIPILLEHFRRYHERKHRKRTLGFTPEALRALASFTWPGNVRDLARACALFVIHAQPGTPIDLALIRRCLPEVLEGAPNPKAGPLFSEGLSFRAAVGHFERELLLAALERQGGSARAARESLGLSKATFHRYLKRLSIRASGDPEG